MIIGFCSQKGSKEELLKDKPQFNIMDSVDIHNIDKVSIEPYYNNTVSLPKRYNQIINKFVGPNGNIGWHEDAIVVLVHDDVVITDYNWIDKLERALQLYDVVGLAGGSGAAIRQPCLWHIMCPRETLRGTVNHVNMADKSVFTTHFGPSGRVLILDGLFLAFKPRKLIEAGVKFDESNPCIAHFYDIDFSLACNKAKLKLGTVNIQATHASPGLKSFTKEWLDGQDWFINKYNRGEY